MKQPVSRPSTNNLEMDDFDIMEEQAGLLAQLKNVVYSNIWTTFRNAN